MNYAAVKYCDIANGIGCRTVLFVSGCRNHCEGCFQPETWDFAYGKPFDEPIQREVLDSMKPEYVRGLTILGGEPFEPENQNALLPFLRRFREELPGKDLWAFTGYVYERDLLEGGRCHTGDTEEMLGLVDVLVDGPFVEAERNLTLQFRGSSNQRLIDMVRTRESGTVELWSNP